MWHFHSLSFTENTMLGGICLILLLFYFNLKNEILYFLKTQNHKIGEWGMVNCIIITMIAEIYCVSTMCIALRSNPVRQVLLSPTAKFRKRHKEISQGFKLIQQFMEEPGFGPICIQSWAPSVRGDTFTLHSFPGIWSTIFGSTAFCHLTHLGMSHTSHWSGRRGMGSWSQIELHSPICLKKISFFPQFRTHIL